MAEDSTMVYDIRHRPENFVVADKFGRFIWLTKRLESKGRDLRHLPQQCFSLVHPGLAPVGVTLGNRRSRPGAKPEAGRVGPEHVRSADQPGLSQRQPPLLSG
jgi:hypothetical protein